MAKEELINTCFDLCEQNETPSTIPQPTNTKGITFLNQPSLNLEQRRWFCAIDDTLYISSANTGTTIEKYVLESSSPSLIQLNVHSSCMKLPLLYNGVVLIVQLNYISTGTGVINLYTPSTGGVSTLTDLGSASTRHRMDATIFNDNMYICSQNNYSIEVLNLKTLEVSNITTLYTNYKKLQVYKCILYVLTPEILIRYDIRNKIMLPHVALPYALNRVNMTIYDDKIYIINTKANGYSDVLDIYDIKTQLLSTITIPDSKAREWVYAYAGRIYIDTNNTNYIYAYDIKSDSFITITMPLTSKWKSIGEYKGSLYCMRGGIGGNANRGIDVISP